MKFAKCKRGVAKKSLNRWFSMQCIKNKKTFSKTKGLSNVPKTRVELARANAHHPLKVACLPIPPPGLICGCKNTTFLFSFYKLMKKNLKKVLKVVTALKKVVSLQPISSPGGEIGRHATLRGWCRLRHASSTLVLGTDSKPRWRNW